MSLRLALIAVVAGAGCGGGGSECGATSAHVQRVIDGIQMTRAALASCFIDDTPEGCADGLASLGAYRKKFNNALGDFSDEPVHDSHSNFADAFRQFAQLIDHRFAGDVFMVPGDQQAGVRIADLAEGSDQHVEALLVHDTSQGADVRAGSAAERGRPAGARGEGRCNGHFATAHR